MAEGAFSSFPQVFVVDSQASYARLPRARSLTWARVGPMVLLLLVSLALLGVLLEAYFIYHLYGTAQVGKALHLEGAKESNEIPHTDGRVQSNGERRPSAHCIGTNTPVGDSGVIPWDDTQGDAYTYLMDYNNGSLQVTREGYYFLYSKVYFNALHECSTVQHRMMKDTKAYGKPLELMRAKRNWCIDQTYSKNENPTRSREDMRNSFLGGVFHLLLGDKIYVTFDSKVTTLFHPADNFMGAFMI